ncbi:MAG: two pore domain potassium channel family protein, partial [Pseudomonadota bacterium]
MLLINLLLATLMVIASVIVHYVGLHILSKWGRRRTERDGLNPPLSRQGFTVVTIVLGIFLLHSIEIWFYAALYLALDQFDTLETALYFSTSTFTTV